MSPDAQSVAAALADQSRFELEARRAKLQQILEAQTGDAERMASIAEVDQDRKQRSREALELLAQLKATGDGAAFASAMEQWCRRPGWAFVGPNGQMFLKQLVNAGTEGESSQLLADVLSVPADDDDAAAKFGRLLSFIERVKHGGHPAPARSPFLLSVFWAMQDEDRWPVAWTSATTSLRNLGWLSKTGDVTRDYLDFARLVRELGTPSQLSHAFFWFDKHRFVGLSPHLRERCTRSRQLSRLVGADGQYVSADVREASRLNTAALIYELWHAILGLQPDLAAVLRHEIATDYSRLDTKTHLYRWWGWASWRVCPAPGSVEALNPREDESHGGTEEVPR